MDLTQLYFAHATRRRQRKARERREEQQREELEESRLEEVPTAAPQASANDTVGFWMIPQGDSFLKLRIASQYNLTSIANAVFRPSKGQKVGNQFDGSWLPVWCFLINAPLLQRHFSWIDDDVLEGLTGDNPKRFAQTLVTRAMRAGWSYVISGSNGVVLGLPKPDFDELPDYIGGLIDELSGEEVHMPTNIRIRVPSGSPRVHLFNAAGSLVKSGSWEDFTGKAQSFGEDAEFLNLVKNLQSPDDFGKLDSDQLKLFMPDNLEKVLARANKDDKTDIGDAILMLVLYYRRTSPTTDISRLQRLAQKALTETTFHDLVRATDQNGGYKNGGLVLVDGHRWVTDPNVRGRSDNSYFVITRPPAISIDNDGDVLLRYMFRSRSDRNTTGMAQSGYIKFLPDKGFFKRVGRAIQRFLKGESMWNRDVHVACSCLTAESLIQMSDGTYRPIGNIKVGDKVITHKGRARAVTAVKVRKTNDTENVYRVKTQGSSDGFIITGEHPFYALRGNSHCLCGCGSPLDRANNARTPHLMLSRKCIQGHGGRKMVVEDYSHGRFDWVKTDDLLDREWFLYPWHAKGSVSIDPRLARLLGYYAAEGSVGERGTTVNLTFGLTEWGTLGDDVINICRQLGYRARKVACDNPEYNWFNVSITNREFKDLCILHVGRGSKTKRLSETLMNLDDDGTKQLLCAMVLGDGSVSGTGGSNRVGRVRFFSTSFDLTAQAQVMLSKLRLRSGLSYHKKKVNKRTSHSKRENKLVSWVNSKCYQTTFSSEASSEFRKLMRQFDSGKDNLPPNKPRQRSFKFQPHEGQLRSLLSKEKIDFHGDVYDITVDEDESFIVHGVVVHNCPDWKYRWAWVASKGGFSHKLGRPGDPTDEAPQQTNPDRKVSLCKHLYQLRLVLNNPPKQFKTELERARKAAEAAGAQLDDKGDLVVEPQAQKPGALPQPGQPNQPEAVQEVPAEEQEDGKPPANDDGIRPNP